MSTASPQHRRAASGLHDHRLQLPSCSARARRQFPLPHPDGRFFVLIIDLDEDGSRLLDESFESLTLGDLDEEMSTLHQMAAAYSCWSSLLQ